MKRVFVDSSGWFAYARADDADHPAAREALARWKGRLVTTDFVFDETLTLMRRRAGHAAAVRVGEALLDPAVVELARLLPEDFEDAWDLFRRRKDKDWSFTDCTSFAAMRRLRLSAAIAFDDDFRQAGFELLPGLG